jgi:hypothetical protein
MRHSIPVHEKVQLINDQSAIGDDNNQQLQQSAIAAVTAIVIKQSALAAFYMDSNHCNDGKQHWQH